MKDDAYFPEYDSNVNAQYLNACHELSKSNKELTVFLDNLFIRLVNGTFLPSEGSDGISLETARELALFIKNIPKRIHKGNEQYLDTNKKKSS